MSEFLLAIDQGTTSTRAIIFNKKGIPQATSQIAHKTYYPKPGWVEQNPEDIWKNTLTCCRKVLKISALQASQIIGLGISNQRETTIIWNKKTGNAIYPAIVWQDRRTAQLCKMLEKNPISPKIAEKTGLRLDPYFSATKIMWLLNEVPKARKLASYGELAFGTVDTYLLWRLTGGKVHVTDATNASRTLLFNIRNQTWDTEILNAFDIPHLLLPEVLDSSAHFGEIAPEFLGKPIKILGVAGDLQAATFGQAAFKPGALKVTFGTGGFMLLNTGNKIITSHNRLLTTIAYRLNKKVTYGLEGSIFSAGIIVKWFRDTLKLIRKACDTEKIARKLQDTKGVYIVPSFTGLGAPYWDPKARAAIIGLTLDSSPQHIIRAGLESVCYQARDLLKAMQNDCGLKLSLLRVDGGMAVNNWFLQFLADILNTKVERPYCVETSALGAAYLAGLQAGLYDSQEALTQLWKSDADFTPLMQKNRREHLYAGWKEAVSRVLTKEME